MDPVFGEVNSSIYTQIRIEQSIDFRPENGSLDNIVVDSVATLPCIKWFFYGEISDQTFMVSEITEDLYTDSIYYSNTDFNTHTNDLSMGNSIRNKSLFPGYFAGELVDQAILSIPLSIPNFALPISLIESGKYN